MKAAVVVPVWRPALSDDERLSLGRCRSVLGGHPIVLVAPEGLSTDALLPGDANVSCERFSPHFFEGIAGYNRLMLSRELYERFDGHDYVLLHQLDAYVFEDRLAEWCAKGFDYVGAPWVGPGWPPPEMAPFKRRILRAITTRETRVGNGGFSLRRVPSFLRALRRLRPLAAAWRSNEDLFWSVVARRLAGFRIPRASEALAFAFELEPRECYERLGRLPFGCHAWPRYDPGFWRAVFARAR